MDSQFNDLNAKYQKAIKDNNNNLKLDLLEQMRSNIKKRNKGNNSFIRSLDNKSHSVPKSTYQELLEINGEMNRIASSQKLTDISNQARIGQTNNNEYGSNNPYPQK